MKLNDTATTGEDIGGFETMGKNQTINLGKIWFPIIDKAVETLIRGCIPCQANSTSSHPVP
jgi:hypothetical protein